MGRPQRDPLEMETPLRKYSAFTKCREEGQSEGRVKGERFSKELYDHEPARA